MHSRGIIGASALFSLATVVAAEGANLPTNIWGFNYGNRKGNGYEAKVKNDYLIDFKNAKELAGAKDKFNSARIYTMVQMYNETEPNEAIEAAIESETTLLLGMWTSADPGKEEENFKKEMNGLMKAIEKYGDKLAKLTVGLSVGSEDLYRNSPTGIANKSPIGANPQDIVKYIEEARKAIKDTPLASVPIGHVDTADVWINGSNKAVIDACDWIGFDEYPYFEKTKENDIKNAAQLFLDAYNKTEAVVGDKPIWITETGWPVEGETMGKGEANKENAKSFWDQIGCRFLGKVNTWWYILEDDGATPRFGITEKGSTKPFYELDCSNVEIDYSINANGIGGENSTESSSSEGSSSGSSSSSGGSGSGSSSASKTSSGSKPNNTQQSSASYVKGFSLSALMIATSVVAFLA